MTDLSDEASAPRETPSVQTASEHAFADAVPAMLWVTDARHVCTFVSRGWTEYTGQTAEDGVGTGWMRAIHPDDRDRAAAIFADAASARASFQLDYRLQTSAGEYRWAIDAGRPRFGEDGSFLGYAGSVIDIHERKLAEEALRHNERDLNRAQAVARTGSWRLDVQRNELRWSDETHRMFGIPRGSPLTYEAFLDRIHEDDRALVDAAWQAALRGEPYEVEHRILVGGNVSWVREKAELEFDENGQLQGGFGTVQDVTEAKQLQEALRLANDQLVEADRRKDEFLGMLSHELRNPLAPIRHSVHILENAAPLDERVAARARSVIRRQTEHLTRLVDDLLDVTRIARGKIDLRRTRVELRDVVSRTAGDFQQVFADQGVAFGVVLPGVELWVDADATRLAQVVGNLLHNAAKFTCRGDEVTLSVTAVAGEAEICVRDTGSGIDPALLPRVFDAFVQGDRTLARSEGGLGLGLALVKGIVELHGGAVRAESLGEGRGAAFMVRLSLSEAAAVEDVPRPRAARPRSGRRVLVVDDNTDAAEAMAGVVEMLGHVAEIAYDGPSALEKARTNPPDVVLCDIGLPGMSGYDVAQALRKVAGGMQVFAVTGYAQPKDVKKALDSGFDGHVAKPVDVADIERLLE